MNSDYAKCNVPLSPGRMIGLSFTSQASLLSLLSVLFLGGWVALKYRENVNNPPGRPWRLLRSNLDAYMINLLLAEIVVAMGGLIDVKWAFEQRTYCGDVCNAQGALAQIGVTATAFFTTAISIQTWNTIYYARPTSYSFYTWFSVSLVAWGYVILFGVVGWSVNPDFYVPIPLWCWIRPKYRFESLFGQYIPLWVCGFGNVLIYVPLYLFSRGNLDFEDRGAGRIRWKWYRRALNDPEREELRSQAWKMLLYPSAYTLQILGTSIVRWMSYINPSLIDIELPELAGMAAASLLFRWVLRLSGFINVLLILTTRPNVLLFGGRGVLPVGDPRAMHNEEFQQHESNTIAELAELNDVSMSDLNNKLGSRQGLGSRD